MNFYFQLSIAQAQKTGIEWCWGKLRDGWFSLGVSIQGGCHGAQAYLFAEQPSAVVFIQLGPGLQPDPFLPHPLLLGRMQKTCTTSQSLLWLSMPGKLAPPPQTADCGPTRGWWKMGAGMKPMLRSSAWKKSRDCPERREKQKLWKPRRMVTNLPSSPFLDMRRLPVGFRLDNSVFLHSPV